MNAHEKGKAEAAAEVLKHWKNVAQKAREAGMTTFAEQAEAQIAALEPKPSNG